MARTDGNGVFQFPGRNAVVVVAMANFNERQPHALTFRLLAERILPAPGSGRSGPAPAIVAGVRGVPHTGGNASGLDCRPRPESAA